MHLHLLPASLLALLSLRVAFAIPATPPAPSLKTIQTRLEASIDILQSAFYNTPTGTYPSSIHWTAAVITTIFASTIPSHTSPPLSLYTLSRLFVSQPTPLILEEAYDDMLWVTLQWSEGFRIQNQYPLTPTQRLVGAYTARAKEFWTAASKGWDARLCGGGMIWAPKLEPYKNAITNELWISASAGLALMEEEGSPEREEYKEAARKGWEWLEASNMKNEEGLFVDGFHISNLHTNSSDSAKKCDARSEAVYTYNQGTLLPGLRSLAILTGNNTYLAAAHELVKDVILKESRLTPQGILTERCDPSGRCSQNGHMFKGIFIAALGSLCAGAEGKWKGECLRYKHFVRRNAEAVWRSRDPEGRFGCWWGAGIQSGELWAGEDDESSPEGGSFEDDRGSKGTGQIVLDLEEDPNERGRGRTVECMASGIAMLATDAIFAML